MPTNILVNEHCLIEQVLGCLERMVERSGREHRLEAEPARDVLAFFRDFTEHRHCNKEETHLRSAMQNMGVSIEQCLGCSMRQRREEGRMHLAAMEEAIGPASASESTALVKFTKHAHAYIDLLLDYIAKQEDCLFPRIAEVLPDSEKAKLSVLLSATNGDGNERREYHSYYDLANKLADHYGMPQANFEKDPAHGG